jgi:chromate transporter
VFWTALRLGCTSFGGPIAHLGYFEREYVQRRRWLSPDFYAGLVALCQLLPGPASSKVGFLVGLHRAGWPGAVAAWIGFTLPSAALMVAGAIALPLAQASQLTPLIHGLKLAAVAVVAQAVWSMVRRLCPDWRRRLIAVTAAGLAVSLGGTATQLLVLAAGSLAGLLLCRETSDLVPPVVLPVGRNVARMALALFLLLLLGLPAAAAYFPHGAVALAATFYRSGALVFGGGHVVLPLLRDALVPAGWIGDERFLAGYGLAQALPGPLFALSAYLGVAMAPAGAGLAWAALALVFIFLPGLLLAIAGSGLWNRLGQRQQLVAALAGVNAAVVGILGAALYRPVSTTAILAPADALIAAAGLLLLERWKTPPLAVVALCVGLSLALNLI